MLVKSCQLKHGVGNSGGEQEGLQLALSLHLPCFPLRNSQCECFLHARENRIILAHSIRLQGAYSSQVLYYGPSSRQTHLLSCLPTSLLAFIVTGSSLATKSSFVQQVKKLLRCKHHARTFSNIKQHGSVGQLDKAADAVPKDSSTVNIRGGPIDPATAISYRQHEKSSKFLYYIAIPENSQRRLVRIQC